MTRKQWLITIAIALALGALFYLQFKQWRFDWDIFLAQTRQANPLRIALAIAIIYAVYALRAVRWSIFLRPVRETSPARLISPMFVGFAGLALLGRPGELIRPYLVAKRENLPVSSQLAVWTVERIFDMGAFALLMGLDLLLGDRLESLPYYKQFERGGLVLIGVIAAVAVVAYITYRNADLATRVAHRMINPFSPRLAKKISQKVRSFSEGLHTIHDMRSLLQIALLSFVIWGAIAVAYVQVIHAYPDPSLREMTHSHALLLMGFSIAGSTVQLPAVGGGSQLTTIVALNRVFGVTEELAVSCGIMLWLVTFMAVIPAGLWLARRQHVSLRALQHESEQEAGPKGS